MNNQPVNRGRAVYWLLLLPFIGTLLPGLYASSSPSLFGFPFFYWYLILWIVLVAVITAIVHFKAP